MNAAAAQVAVPVDVVREAAAALRAAGADLVRAEVRKPAGSAPYDVRPLLALAAHLDRALDGVADIGNAVGQDHDPYVTVRVLGTRTGVPARTLTEWGRTGRVRRQRVGRSWLLHEADVTRETERRKG